MCSSKWHASPTPHTVLPSMKAPHRVREVYVYSISVDFGSREVDLSKGSTSVATTGHDLLQYIHSENQGLTEYSRILGRTYIL